MPLNHERVRMEEHEMEGPASWATKYVVAEETMATQQNDDGRPRVSPPNGITLTFKAKKRPSVKSHYIVHHQRYRSICLFL